jgi:hypothetical protein
MIKGQSGILSHCPVCAMARFATMFCHQDKFLLWATLLTIPLSIVEPLQHVRDIFSRGLPHSRRHMARSITSSIIDFQTSARDYSMKLRKKVFPEQTSWLRLSLIIARKGINYDSGRGNTRPLPEEGLVSVLDARRSNVRSNQMASSQNELSEWMQICTVPSQDRGRS